MNRSSLSDRKAILHTKTPAVTAPTRDSTMDSEATTPAPKTSSKSRSPEEPSTSQSALTSIPSEIGSTPEGLSGHVSDQRWTRSGSPVSRRSKRIRKLSARALDAENSSTDSLSRAVKRRKISSPRSVYSSTSSRVSIPGHPCSGSSSSQIPDPVDKVLPKLVFKLNKQVETARHHEDFPESNIRSEPPRTPASPLLFTELFKDRDNNSVETDITLSFLSKLRNQHYQPVNDTADISKYIHRFAPDNPSYHERATRSTAASGAEKGSNNGSAAASPSEKAARSNNTAKGAKGQGKLGKGKGRNSGNGGRDRDSPEPNEKAARTQNDQVLLKSVRQRQLELKKWYAIVGAQQMEALEIMSSRDLSKLHKKSTAHIKVPEYDELMRSLQAKEVQTRFLVNKEYRMREELAIRSLEAQKEVIEKSFLNRAREAKMEHLKGAEGDLMILQGAHKSQVDETRTDNGSEGATNLPLYHELPEPNARIRGYSSVRIDDEKPFKEHLASYDEQAQREVIDDDIVAPVMHSVAQQNAQRSAEEERKAREKLNQLAVISETELKRINSYRVARPPPPQTNPQFNLSRLADCADLVSQRGREKKYHSLPDAPRALPALSNDSFQRLTRPIQLPNLLHQSQADPPQSLRPRSPPSRKKKTSIAAATRRLTKEDEPQSQSSSSTSTPLPNLAPAPLRMPPPPSSSQHHHHHMPLHAMPPPPTSTTAVPLFPRHSNLAPLIIPKTSSTPPGTPIHAQGYPQSSQIPPPPSPYQSRPSPVTSTFQHQQSAPRALHSYPVVSHPTPPSPFLSQTPRSQTFEQPPQQSSIEQAPPPPPPPPPPSQLSNQTQAPRFALNNSISPHVSRHLGQRRGSGQITFTPTQTPSSERFTRPPGPAPQLPGRSVIRPAQLANGMSTPNRSGNAAPSSTPEARAQSAADIARQNAAKNQVQGAGPKGGRRVLLPKSLT